MKNDAIEQAAELFREKIQNAQNSSNRSQDILRALREFLEDIGTNIPNAENTSIPQEVLHNVEALRNKIGSK